jgi:two-component system cell cycle sensor histidine kinase/response regulator CckA
MDGEGAVMPLQGFVPPDFEAVFAAAPGNYLLLDSDLTIVGVTDSYLSATMTRREEIRARKLFDVFPDNPNDPTADGVRNLYASLRRVLANKRPDRMLVQKYDIRRPEAEGGGFEERFWSPLNTPVLAADGSVRYIVHWVEDVTEFMRLRQEMEREQAELTEELRSRASKIEAETFLRVEAVAANQRLTESERRYRFLTDAVPQLIWTADQAGMLDFCNERWRSFTGLPSDRLRGTGWQEALHPEDRDRIALAWAEAVRTRAPRFQAEHRLRRHDGTWRWMLTTALPYRDRHGQVQQWFGATTDIHDRVIAEQQIRQAQRLQAAGKLAGGMAHEVNNMMSAVLGFGELALQALEPTHPVRLDVSEMIKAGARAADVTRQLLAFSRQQVLKPTVIDIGTVVTELTPVLQQLAGSDRRLEVILTAPRVRTLADRSQIEQVLINLVSNARDATGTDGVILVDVGIVSLDASALDRDTESGVEPGRFARLAIKDNGAGMPPDIAARAFEPFFTTKPVGQGTGLGLSMVHGIAQQSGGFAWIDSKAGEGTTVAFYLPLVEADLTPDALVLEVTRGKGEGVLIVEDEAVVRSLARRVLEAYGYIVYQAPNGGVALDFLATHLGEIDLVLTDIVMPRMSGQELAQRIGERYPHIPVLFMSGYSGDEIVQRGLMLAGLPFIPKPWTAEQLARAVRDQLDRARPLLQGPTPPP